MNSDDYIRGFGLLAPQETALMVIDLQERLVPAMTDSERIVERSCRLLRAAPLFQVPIFLTEQYPKGLGPTVTPVAECLSESVRRFEKKTFSCCESADLRAALRDSGVRQVLLCGVEGHVCVAQTALDLMAVGLTVFLAVDASGSRHPEDYCIAQQRLRDAGVTLTTSEAAIFEWCRTADHPHFKEISRLVK